MLTVDEAVERIRAMARPDQVAGMARFGIGGEGRLGLAVPDMRKLAKEIGRDHKLALALWKTGIPDARIVAGMIAEPDKLTARQMDAWVKGFDSWDVCDQVCMNLFDKSPLAWDKVIEWSARDEEFVKRAAYALIACLAWHDKREGDGRFLALLPVIVRGATDERTYVRKAVNWALRQLGKRNQRLRRAAIKTAKEIGRLSSKAARWIAADALRELERGARASPA